MVTKKKKLVAAQAATPPAPPAIVLPKPMPPRIGEGGQFHLSNGVWRSAVVQDVDASGTLTLRLWCIKGDPTPPARPHEGLLIERVTPYPGPGGSHGVACDYEVTGARMGLDLYCWRR